MAGLALAVTVPTAYGSVLNPPQSAVPPDFWASCTGCVSLGSGIFGTGSTSPNLGFVYSAGVFTNDPQNPYGLNDLDFIYSILNNATSTALISRITATNFSGYNTDVGYFTAAVFGGTILPTTVDRNSASTVGFTFNSFSPGNQSLVLVIKTNATAFSSGSLNIIDSAGSSTSVMAFAPVPEPGLLWPLGCAMLAMAAYWRKRANQRA
jgi:hypothetical protein